MSDTTQPKYVVAIDYGYDGWSLNYFDTLEEAIKSEKDGNKFEIFKTVNYKIIEV